MSNLKQTILTYLLVPFGLEINFKILLTFAGGGGGRVDPMRCMGRSYFHIWGRARIGLF